MNFKDVAVLGLVGVAAYAVWRLFSAGTTATRTGVCDDMHGLPGLLCNLGVWTTGANPDGSLSDEPVETRTNWCASLGRYIDPTLTCPRDAEPYVPSPPTPVQPPPLSPNEVDIGDPWHDQRQCSPGFEWLEPIGCIPAYSATTLISDRCMFPNGDILTVPPGMDCSVAIDDMCQRFGSGYKGCP